MIPIKYGVSMLNEIDFHKKKMSIARIEPSQPLVPFSIRHRLLELVFYFYGNYSFFNYPLLCQIYTHTKIALHVKNEAHNLLM